MKWLLRFLLWATPLTWLATRFYPQYLRFLSSVAIALFSLVGISMRLEQLDVLAPIDLALFAALALSSFDVRWPARLARLFAGLAVLFVLEIVMLMGGLYLFLIRGLPPGSSGALLFQNVESLIGWAGAPVVWVVLFRPRQLGTAASRSSRLSVLPSRIKPRAQSTAFQVFHRSAPRTTSSRR
jgi:hypothetical protein